MAPHAAPLEHALAKKGGLTLAQLANYDDLITDALVDKVRLHCERDSLQQLTCPGQRSTTGLLSENCAPGTIPRAESGKTT